MKKFAILFAVTALSVAAVAQAKPTPAVDMKTFWDCDYAASKSLIDPASAAVCSQNYEVVKHAKFGGDFNALMSYWKHVKPREYAARDALRK